MRRAPLALLLSLVTCLGCAPSAPPVGDYLADWLPIVDQGVSTDIILPPYRDSPDLLRRGWEAPSGPGAADSGWWVLDGAGDFRFYSATAGEVTIEAEATALSTPDAPQTVEIFLNGESVSASEMTREWNRYEFALPNVRVGWNDVAMRFAQALRPRDISPQSQDARRLSARFRRLRVRSSSGRGLWPDRPPRVQVAGDGTGGGSTIEMPTDSVVNFHILPRHDTVLRGEVDVVVVSPDGDRVTGSVDIIDEAGLVHGVFEHEHATEGGPSAFEISFEPWSGQAVQLRLRSVGSDNGVVRWGNMMLVSPRPDPSVVEVIRPTHVVTPPISGRLGRPDVLLILLDAARADAFNQDSVSTPAVDALSVGGTRFEGAIAPAPWTGQSVPSMLTGWYPGAIGAEVWRSPIPVDVPTLAERLSGVGYHTVVWSQHNIYSNNETFRRGFEDFIESRGTVLDRALLPGPDDLFPDDRPTFALIHLLPPHGPYRPPEPFDGSLSSWYTGDFPQSAASLGRAAQPTGRKPTADDVRYIRSRYDENVRFADHLVGQLVQMFRDAGRYDDAVVIVTSDHGEGFFEHGRFLHTALLYEEFIRIPLVVKWPGGEEGFAPAVDTDVSLVDLVPTLADGLGLPDVETGFQGRTLLPLVFDGEMLERDVLVQTRGAERLDATPRPVLALLSNGFKVIFNEEAGTLETFDLTTDPEERRDLTDDQPLRARALLQRLLLQRYRNAMALAEQDQAVTEPLDEDAIRRLRALGYLR